MALTNNQKARHFFYKNLYDNNEALENSIDRVVSYMAGLDSMKTTVQNHADLTSGEKTAFVSEINSEITDINALLEDAKG